MPVKLNQAEAALHLTVASKDGHILGRVTGATLPEPLFFSDLGQLVLSLDALFDERNYPQAYQRARRFKPIAKAQTDNDAPSFPLPEGAEELTLNVLSRRSSTWQGFLTWPDGHRDSFVSTLLLLRLLNDHFGL